MVAICTLAASVLLFSGFLQTLAISSKVLLFGKSITAPPLDTYIAGEKLTRLSTVISRAGCSVNFVNQGAISLLSRTTHCTKFPYLVYADQKSQADLIKSIADSNVNAVIVDSNDWSSSIDNRRMSERLPEVHRYVLKAFPKHESLEGFLVAMKNGK